MTIEEFLYDLLSPLCDGRVYFDETPKDGPEGYPYIVITMAGGKRSWFVEQEMPDKWHYRVTITGVVRKNEQVARSTLMTAIEAKICRANLPGTQPYGGMISGSSTVHEELYGSQQFGLYFAPAIPAP